MRYFSKKKKQGKSKETLNLELSSPQQQTAPPCLVKKKRTKATRQFPSPLTYSQPETTGQSFTLTKALHSSSLLQTSAAPVSHFPLNNRSTIVSLPLSHKTTTTYSFLLSQPHLSFRRPSSFLSKVFPSRQSKKTAHSRLSTQIFRLSLDQPPSTAQCPFHLHSQNHNTSFLYHPNSKKTKASSSSFFFFGFFPSPPDSPPLSNNLS
jgi:hypothetical protein